MPIYEYQCKCGQEKDVLRQMDECNNPQPCDICKGVMERKFSAYNFAFVPTGKGMALDSLNSGVTGGKRKAWAESQSAKGLETAQHKYY